MLEENRQDPLPIPNATLKRPKIFNKDVLGTKHDFQQIGGNEFLQIEPSIAKFTGFEINKLNILKLRVINKASVAQRIHVLPSKKENNVFQVKMMKKGQLAPGMNEDIFIHFRPSEYRYYYDTLRINSETCNLVIPIHAYPVPNRQELREQFPKIIDFGTVDIGEQQVIRQQLKSRIPLNFEYEFVFTKNENDISIQPIKGIIPGNGQIDIDLIYQPTNNATVVANVELRLSQFDYEPLNIKLIGNGRYPNPSDLKNKMKLEPINRQTNSQYFGLKSNQSNFLQSQGNYETNMNDQIDNNNSGINNKQQYKTLMRPSSKRQKLLQAQQQSKQYLNDTKNLKESQGQFENKQMRNNQSQQQIDQEQNQSQYDNNTEIGNESEYGQKQTIFTMVNSMRQQLEKEFIDKFNEVRLLDKNKEIKFFQCVGDKVISKESTEEIEKERVEYKNEELREIQQQGVERYELLLNQDTPIIEQVVPSFDCQWDYDKNDPMKRRFLIQKKLTKVGTLIILKHRKEERLQKIKNFLNGATTKEEVKQLVNQDHQKAEYAGIGKKDFTAFSFEFEEHNIDKFLLPVQYESSNNFSNFKFEVNPRTGFDDWTAIEPIDYCDYEIMDYRNKDMPQIVLNPPIESQRKLRTGAEEEYGHLTKTGQFGDITEEKYIAEPIPKSFAKPLEIQAHQLLLPHSTIRRYEQYYEVTEVDPEYYLQHDPIQTQDEFDPNPLEEDPTVLKYDFLRKTPGLNSIQCLNSLPIEYQYYYNKRQDLPKDYGYESEMEKYCPGILPNIDYDDILTDDDSDGDAPPNIEIENVKDFLNDIEDKEEELQNIKQKNAKEVQDEFEQVEKTINQNLENEKQKQISFVPSKTSDYNRYINENTNKLYIL